MAHLLIVDLPGGNDTDILQAAMDRGDEFTFLTARLDHYQQQPQVFAQLSLARALIEVRSFDYAEVEQQVVAAHAQHPIDAVLCLVDTRLIDAAKLAQRLGTRHVSPLFATMLRDKFSVRCRMTECGLVQPEFLLAESNAELRQAVEAFGLPVLIKPSDGYASQNIVVLRHPEDLDPLMSPLDDMLPCRTDYGLGVQSNDRMLVERFMAGRVVGCDTQSVNGHHRLLGVHEKLFFAPPSFAIRGGTFQPNGPAFAAMQTYVFAVLDAVRFNWGATHIELMITSDGLRLIEINARLVGAKIARQVGFALNRSLHQDLIAMHLGETPHPSRQEHNSVAVTRWVVAAEAGTLEQIELPLWHDPRIRSVELLKGSGDAVRPPLENADRLGCVMVCSSSRADAEQLAERFVSETIVRIKPHA